jgi:glycosyltransferase involved in cell wall biosynthesis
MLDKTIIIFNPSVEGGGVEKNLFIISNYLCRKINNVRLISSNYQKNKFSNKLKIINSKIFQPKSRLGRYLVCIPLLIREIIKNKNVIVFSFQANLYATIICFLLSIPIVIRANSSPTSWANNLIKRFVYKIFYKYPKKIIVNSYDFKKQMKSILSLNSICIYNPLNKNFIKRQARKKNSLNFYKKTNLKIISNGRLTDQKNHILILKALKKIKKQVNFKLIILGQGENKNKLIDFINKNHLKKNVKIINYRKNPYSYLLKANLFVLSSVYEGLPNVLLEAMVLKKFIISSNCPTGPSEILRNGKYGLLYNSNQTLDLSRKIIFFYKNRNFCKKKTVQAYNALDRFDLNKNLDKYLKVLKF